jgi:hypothetical protein
LLDEEHHHYSQSKNYSGDQIEEELMGCSCGTYGAQTNSYKVVVEKPKVKRRPESSKD